MLRKLQAVACLAGIGQPTSLLGITRGTFCTVGKVVCVAAAEETVSDLGQACQSAHLSEQMATGFTAGCCCYRF